MVHVSKPRARNQSMADESARPGTCRSKVGCEAIDEPCTKRIVPFFSAPCNGGLFHRNSLTLRLFVQCSVPPFQTTDPSGIVFLLLRDSPCSELIPFCLKIRSAAS